MSALTVGAVGLVLGAIAGAGIRLLLAALRRGAVLRAGPIEAGAAAITATGAAISWGSPLLAVVVWIGLFGVALGAVDLAHHRLPDALTFPGIVATAGVLAITHWSTPAAGSLTRAAIAGVVWAGSFAVIAAVTPANMGWGDVKLVLSLGAATGYLSAATALLAVCAAFVLAALVAIVGIGLRNWTPRSAIAFGPFLLIGSWLALLVGT
ncbi:MAG: prepilin peptidase [Nakamurella sp.]